MKKESIGERIKKLRIQRLRMAAPEEKKYWSRIAMAERLGITPSALGYIERGDVEVPRHLEAFAQELGVSEEYLLYGDAAFDEEDDLKMLRAIKLVRKISLLSPGDYALVDTLVENLLRGKRHDDHRQLKREEVSE